MKAQCTCTMHVHGYELHEQLYMYMYLHELAANLLHMRLRDATIPVVEQMEISLRGHIGVGLTPAGDNCQGQSTLYTPVSVLCWLGALQTRGSEHGPASLMP